MDREGTCEIRKVFSGGETNVIREKWNNEYS